MTCVVFWDIWWDILVCLLVLVGIFREDAVKTLLGALQHTLTIEVLDTRACSRFAWRAWPAPSENRNTISICYNRCYGDT